MHEGRVLTINAMEYFDGECFVLFYEEHDEGEYLRVCQPIPHTPEILEQAGFCKKMLGPLQYFDKGYNPITRDPLVTLEWSEQLGYFFYHNAGHPIRYVHQLQNLYLVLTGEELPMHSLKSFMLLEGKCVETLVS